MKRETCATSICFVAHNAYGALANRDNGHIGGIEHQQSLMAKWLARRGRHVSMITWDEGQEDGAEIDGVRNYKMCRKDTGLRGLRFVWPRWASLWQAMRRADADIYYYNCGDLGLGQVVAWCRRHRRQCVYSVASEPDCDPRLPRLRPFRERVLYRYGLRKANRVIVQSRRQQRMLREYFGRNSIVIPMPCEGPDGYTHTPTEMTTSRSAAVLWVGRISREKRFEWLLDVARRCPDIVFDVVGVANIRSSYVSDLMKPEVRTANVRMHGRVLHTSMSAFYRSATVLCCTSVYEGFPNTFLEAWSVGLPIVSTFDPDGVIARHGLGWTTPNIDGLVDGIRRAIASPEVRLAASKAARSYYLANHTVDSCMEQFERVFQEAATSSSGRRR